jgi:hypothetical protein
MKNKLAGALILTVIMITTTFASTPAGFVNQKVLTQFEKQFSQASEVVWVKSETYYKANFKFNEQYISAYFSSFGELIGITKNIRSTQLPIKLQTGLKKLNKDKWITELYEFSESDGTFYYYVTLQNADEKVVLRSEGASWNLYKKARTNF